MFVILLVIFRSYLCSSSMVVPASGPCVGFWELPLLVSALELDQE